MDESEELKLVLIGEPGKGKSATGNKILGEEIFKTSDFEVLSTYICDWKNKKINNRSVTVIDTPGFENDGNDTRDFERAISIIAQVQGESPGNFKAFIFVKKFGDRWNRSEAYCIDFLKENLGLNVLREFGVVVYTHGDLFYRKYEDRKTFAQWIEENSSSSQSNLIAECNNRYVLFDNDLNGPSNCVDELFDVIRLSIDGFLPNNQYQVANTFREQLVQRYPQADFRIQRSVRQFRSLLKESLNTLTVECLRKAAENLEHSVRESENSQILQNKVLNIKRIIRTFAATQSKVSLQLIKDLKSELRSMYNLPLEELAEFIKNLVASFLECLGSCSVGRRQLKNQ